MQQKKALIVKSFAVVLLSLSLATLIYAVLIQDIVQLQTRNIGFYLPISLLGSLTVLLLLLASMLKIYPRDGINFAHDAHPTAYNIQHTSYINGPAECAVAIK